MGLSIGFQCHFHLIFVCWVNYSLHKLIEEVAFQTKKDKKWQPFVNLYHGTRRLLAPQTLTRILPYEFRSAATVAATAVNGWGAEQGQAPFLFWPWP